MNRGVLTLRCPLRKKFDLKLTSEAPYWYARNGIGKTYPFLDKDRRCEIAIVGAGVTASIIAYEVSKLGRSMVMLDSRDVCRGSTSASTALLQYEIDLPLVEMSKIIGEDRAQRAYQLSHESIYLLEKIVHESGIECDFRKNVSIYHGSTRNDALLLAEEARARKLLGLDVTYHNRDEVSHLFGLPGQAALSSNQAASCDPVKMARGLLERCSDLGVEIYDRTSVAKCDRHDDFVILTTDRGPQVLADFVIFANGFESQSWLKEKIVNLNNTYAFVSQPLTELGDWDRDWMLWEVNRPYIYLRITDDGRLLAGGEDDYYHNPSARDRRLPTKVKRIVDKVQKLIPSLSFEVEHSWAGTFGSTRDGLAYIGVSPEYKRCIFGLGFGGNGITFSAIASQLIPSILEGRPSRDLELFRFRR